MILLTLIRQFFCPHADTTPHTVDGRFYRECLHCGHCSRGIPVGPGWHLVKESK